MAELRDSGVHALKIEGRMKRPEYVAAAVTAVKNAVEGRPVDFDALRSVFSRSGFTTGYFDDKIDKTMFGRPARRRMWSPPKGCWGTLPSSTAKRLPGCGWTLTSSWRRGSPPPWPPGMRMATPPSPRGMCPKLQRISPPPKKRWPRALPNWRHPLLSGELTADIGEGLILPVSALNAMRRQVLEEIGEKRSALHPAPFQDVGPYHPKLLNIKIPALRARVLTAAQLSPLALEQCEQIAMPVDALLARAGGRGYPLPGEDGGGNPPASLGLAHSTQEKRAD